MIHYRELIKTTSATYIKRCSKYIPVALLTEMFDLLINHKSIDLGCCGTSSKTFTQPSLPIRAGPVTEDRGWEDVQMISGKAPI